jgi:hypothetical protein
MLSDAGSGARSVGPVRFGLALARYRVLGLLDHLGAEQIAELERRVRSRDLKRIDQLPPQVPELVAEQPFDGGGAPHP